MTIDQTHNSHAFIEKEKSIPFGEGMLEVSRGAENATELKDLKELRSKFVSLMGWFPEGHEDDDRYDRMDETFHLAIRDYESTKIVAGLRLTQVESFEKSLSWSMIENHDEMTDQIKGHINERGQNTFDELNRLTDEGNVWDLTRLVNPLDGSVDATQMVGAIVELFAVGTALTAQRNDEIEKTEDLKWIFATTPLLKQSLDRLGIGHEVLARGRVSPEDEYESYFCVTEPMNVLQSLYNKQDKYAFTIQHVADGFKKANAL